MRDGCKVVRECFRALETILGRLVIGENVGSQFEVSEESRIIV